MLRLQIRKLNSTNMSEEGVVDEVVHQGREWRIQFQASYWTARSHHLITLVPGDLVRIIGRDNITLLVESVR